MLVAAQFACMRGSRQKYYGTTTESGNTCISKVPRNHQKWMNEWLDGADVLCSIVG
jgi:hypothetical protein